MLVWSSVLHSTHHPCHIAVRRSRGQPDWWTSDLPVTDSRRHAYLETRHDLLYNGRAMEKRVRGVRGRRLVLRFHSHSKAATPVTVLYYRNFLPVPYNVLITYSRTAHLSLMDTYHFLRTTHAWVSFFLFHPGLPLPARLLGPLFFFQIRAPLFTYITYMSVDVVHIERNPICEI